MLVLLAGTHDAVAARAVNALPDICDAVLMTPASLSQCGWTLTVPPRSAGTLPARGKLWPLSAIRGVLVRLDAVHPAELTWIHADDRAYVAAEMTAFLAAWLAQLTVPVLNSPRGASLCGPGWRPERWLLEASRAGIAVEPLAMRARIDDDDIPARRPADSSVTVVGDDVVGGSAPEKSAAKQLAQRAACGMVRAQFVDGRLLAADPWIDLGDPAVLSAAERWAAQL